MSSIAHELASLLRPIRTPGDFYATGTTDLPLPLLTVQGVGRVALPLLPVQAERLVAVADRAPYGRGEETLVDIAVRRTWQIGADRVRIEGPRWERTLQSIVERATEGLGVAATTVVPELYKLLVYDESSFFVKHRDTGKAAGMFATLIVALPSVHAGGDLLVHHKDREACLDLRSPDPSRVVFAAFYADCVHAVLPVTSGCRLTLVYNLLRKGGAVRPSHRATKPERPASRRCRRAGLPANRCRATRPPKSWSIRSNTPTRRRSCRCRPSRGRTPPPPPCWPPRRGSPAATCTRRC